VGVLFASDTAYTPVLGSVARARGIAAAIIGNGAYDPWIANHASPEQVWRMFEESGAVHLLPVHWDTFRLGKEPLGEAMRRLLTAAGSRADAVVIRRIGETWTMPMATAQ
jgi:L-ascorbate metabolism protein UlaG (beta-lactamase superfamily)